MSDKKIIHDEQCAMKTITALMLVLLAWSLPAGAQMPYPIWREVGGTNYDLRPLYAWRSDMIAKAATSQSTAELERGRPYSDWIGANFWERFTVKAVRQPDVLLVEGPLGGGRTNSTEMVIRHYPRPASLTEGQILQFFACPTGQCAWTNQPGVVKTLPLFYYGTPCASAQSFPRMETTMAGPVSMPARPQVR